MARLHHEYGVLRKLTAEVHQFEDREAMLGQTVCSMVASTVNDFSTQVCVCASERERGGSNSPLFSHLPARSTGFTVIYIELVCWVTSCAAGER